MGLIKKGDIFETNNFGRLKVIAYKSNKDILVEFEDTGYQVKAEAGNIRKGTVRDKLKPTVAGVGFIGIGEADTKSASYWCWSNMLKRCYLKSSLKRRPTYTDCTVCEEWHNLQNFHEWYKENYVEGYDLDKDILKEGNKIYSPETCKFVSRYENSLKSQENIMYHSKVRSPEGEIISIYNQVEFCKEWNINRRSFNDLLNSKIRTYKGWSLVERGNPDK